MMWANFQEKNVQFSLKVALVKVSIFIFIHVPKTHCVEVLEVLTALIYIYLKNNNNDCSKMGPFSVEVHSDYQTVEDV
jgi:hypothetical protein